MYATCMTYGQISVNLEQFGDKTPSSLNFLEMLDNFQKGVMCSYRMQVSKNMPCIKSLSRQHIYKASYNCNSELNYGLIIKFYHVSEKTFFQY